MLRTLFDDTDSQWFLKVSDPKNAKKNKAEPSKRWGHSSVVSQDRLFIYGGAAYNSNFQNSEIFYQLDLVNWNWSKLVPMGASPGVRDSHSCVAYQDKLYVFGGSVGSESRNDLWEYDIPSNVWRPIETKGEIPSPREGHSACLFSERYMVVYGGWDGSQIFNDCYLFDIPHRVWIKVQNKLEAQPITREGHSYAMIKNSIYFFGGQGMNTLSDNKTYDNFFNELYKLAISIEEDSPVFTWEKVETGGSRPTRRSAHSSCSYNDRYLFIIGGEGYPSDINEETLTEADFQAIAEKRSANEEYPCHPKNDVWFYDVETNEWAKLKIGNTAEFEARFAQTCSVYQDYVISFGGLKDYDTSTNDVYVLSLNGSNPFAPKAQLKNDKFKAQDLRINEMDEVKISRPNKPLALRNDAQAFSNVVKKPEGTYESRRDYSNSKQRALPFVSASFSNCLANLITWPLASFGLFLDNALITKASNFRINFVEKQKQAEGNMEVENQPANEETKKSSPYIIVEDDGKGWKYNDFTNIIMNYDTDGLNVLEQEPNQEEPVEENPLHRLNEYALHLKAAGFRLGNTIIYVTQFEDEISLGYLSSVKDLSLNSGEPAVCVWRKGKNEYLTQDSEKTKAAILQKIQPFISEEELFNGIDKVTNRVIVLNLTQVLLPRTLNQKGGEYEITLDTKSPLGKDIVTNNIGQEIGLNSISHQLIEVSLRSYLRYFFLDPSQTNIKIFLNEDPVNLTNSKELVSSQIDKAPFIKLEDKGLYEGYIVLSENKASSENIASTTEETAEKSQEPKQEELPSQGVLLYFKNRLIRRLENSKLGDFTFLTQSYNKFLANAAKSKSLFNYYGFIQLSNFFKPDLLKMEIENPYFSNYVYSTVTCKITELTGKRERKEFTEEPEDQVVKKIKSV